LQAGCPEGHLCQVEGGDYMSGLRRSCDLVLGSAGLGERCEKTEDCGYYNDTPLVCHEERCTAYCDNERSTGCPGQAEENGQLLCRDVSEQYYSQPGTVEKCELRCVPALGVCDADNDALTDDSYLACVLDEPELSQGQGVCFETNTSSQEAIGCQNTCSGALCIQTVETFKVYSVSNPTPASVGQVYGRCLGIDMAGCTGGRVSMWSETAGFNVCVFSWEVCDPAQGNQCQHSEYNGHGVCVPVPGVTSNPPANEIKGICIKGCNENSQCDNPQVCRGRAQPIGLCRFHQCDPRDSFSAECRGEKCVLHGLGDEYWSGGGYWSECRGLAGKAAQGELCAVSKDCDGNMICHDEIVAKRCRRLCVPGDSTCTNALPVCTPISGETGVGVCL